MGYKNCPNCNKEFYIREVQYPFTDKGSSLSCTNCGTILHSWGKGTYDYFLHDAEEIKAQQKRAEWEANNYPKCDCGVTMVKRESYRGKFFGCARFPRGCTKTVDINE